MIAKKDGRKNEFPARCDTRKLDWFETRKAGTVNP